MQYKLLAVDLDGTLLNKFKKIEKVDLDAIKHFISLGGIVIVSTGRHYAACKKYVTQIEDYTGKPIPYVITLNGAEVYNDKGEVVFTDHISKDVVEGINKILKKNKIIYFCYPVAQSLEKQTPYANSRVIKFFSATRHAIAPIYSKEYYAGDVYKLNIMSLNSKKLTRVKHEILEHYKNKIVFFPHNSFF